MQEVQPKRKLTPADGAHVFYTAIFLTGAYIVKTRYNSDCGDSSIDLGLFVDFLFYGLLMWATFLIVSLLPRYKNENLRLFFNIIDIVYGLYHLGLVIYAAVQFYSPKASDCVTLAPQTHFLAHLYILITGFTAGIILLGYLAWFSRKIFKSNAGFQQQNDF